MSKLPDRLAAGGRIVQLRAAAGVLIMAVLAEQAISAPAGNRASEVCTPEAIVAEQLAAARDSGRSMQ